MRRLRRWYIPACRGQRGPAGRASPQAGAGLRAGARRGRRRPAARIAAAVYVSPELYLLPVSQEFASLRPPLGGRTRLVIIIIMLVAVPPKARSCPFPHWPPIIPPLIALLLSLLMIPCYCYSCGPWSGPYWADERRKLHGEPEPIEQPPPRPMKTSKCGRGSSYYCNPSCNRDAKCVRCRPLTNGYGRL